MSARSLVSAGTSRVRHHRDVAAVSADRGDALTEDRQRSPCSRVMRTAGLNLRAEQADRRMPTLAEARSILHIYCSG
jgi:hypothetical protein